MSLSSAIEWTDATWNPVRGCTKISPGCKLCYAETLQRGSVEYHAIPMIADSIFGPTERNHVWWGVSVENRKHGLPRIDELRRTPARIKFLSVEPLLEDLGRINLQGINWMIVGGESGRGARPMQEEWVQSLRRQCREQKVRFFFKQWVGVNKKMAAP